MSTALAESPQQIVCEMPRMHPGQEQARRSIARFKVLACGRRWGKTRLGVALTTAVGVQQGRAWWIAPSYAIAEIGWRQIKGLARQLPGCTIREGDRLVEFPGGGWVQVRTAGDDPEALRGEGLDFVVLDEAAYMCEEVWTHAIRPALSDRKGGALFISTPRGRFNWFCKLWEQAGKCADGTWARWQAKTIDNPFISEDEIAQAKAELAGAPEALIAQEFDAEFSDEAQQAVFSGRILDQVEREHCKPPICVGMLAFDTDAATCRVSGVRFVDDARGPLSMWAVPDPLRNYAIGADIGQGLGASNSVLCVVDVQTREVVAEFTSNRHTPEDLASQASALAQFYGGQLGLAYVAWEANNAGVFGKRLLAIGHGYVHWSQDELSASPHRTRVPGWNSSPATKLTLLADMRGAMARGEFIPHGKQFIAECREYVFSPSWVPMSVKSLDKPEGERQAHGDRVIAYAVAWLATKCQPKARPPARVAPEHSVKRMLDEAEAVESAEGRWNG